jgi:hypothetical protein
LSRDLRGKEERKEKKKKRREKEEREGVDDALLGT